MRKRISGLLGISITWCAAAASNPSDEVLDPEKAFRLSARVVAEGTMAHGIELRYDIEPGYYLYRDRFKLQAPGLPIGELRRPEGVAKTDPFVGTALIYQGAVTLQVPFAGSVAPGSYVVRVTAQGCAEERVCYAPFTQAVTVTLPVR